MNRRSDPNDENQKILIYNVDWYHISQGYDKHCRPRGVSVTISIIENTTLPAAPRRGPEAGESLVSDFFTDIYSSGLNGRG